MESECKRQIIALIKREVVPAIGCTEPIAVSLAVARATELLGEEPQSIEVLLSPNVLKNAMGVGIPSTDKTGLPMAIALGATIGKSEYGLEVLKNSSAEAVSYALAYLESHNVVVERKKGDVDKLYIEVVASNNVDNSRVIIEKGHTKFVCQEINGEAASGLEKSSVIEVKSVKEEKEVELSMERVYQFAMTTPLEELEFILDGGELNKKAAELSLKADYGHALGKMIASHKNMIGDTVWSKTLSYTSAACDARMAGAMVPVMSNSGSGNQGISATLPIVMYAEEHGASRGDLIRALTLSQLMVIYIKQSLGRLSALCGCVVAATGSSCGITYLMGGSYKQITYAVQNMIANITGMICDGAKPSCSLKVTTGVSTALLSAMMAIEDKCVSPLEGIIDEDVDKTIRNLTRIGSEGMSKTDELVLDIMTNKC